MGIDWAFDNLSILNLKMSQKRFEYEDLRVVMPLYPDEGDECVELVRENLVDINLDNFYKVTMCCEDYASPTVDGKLSWTTINSYSSDFDDALENC